MDNETFFPLLCNIYLVCSLVLLLRFKYSNNVKYELETLGLIYRVFPRVFFF